MCLSQSLVEKSLLLSDATKGRSNTNKKFRLGVDVIETLIRIAFHKSIQDSLLSRYVELVDQFNAHLENVKDAHDKGLTIDPQRDYNRFGLALRPTLIRHHIVDPIVRRSEYDHTVTKKFVFGLTALLERLIDILLREAVSHADGKHKRLTSKDVLAGVEAHHALKHAFHFCTYSAE